jgi:hypothetical protein
MERIWKEGTVAHYEILFWNFSRDLRKIMETSRNGQSSDRDLKRGVAIDTYRSSVRRIREYILTSRVV